MHNRAPAATSVGNVHVIYIVSKRLGPDGRLHQGRMDVVPVNQIRKPLQRIASLFRHLRLVYVSPNLSRSRNSNQTNLCIQHSPLQTFYLGRCSSLHLLWSCSKPWRSPWSSPDLDQSSTRLEKSQRGAIRERRKGSEGYALQTERGECIFYFCVVLSPSDNKQRNLHSI